MMDRTRAIVGKVLIWLVYVDFVKGILRVWGVGGGAVNHTSLATHNRKLRMPELKL